MFLGIGLRRQFLSPLSQLRCELIRSPVRITPNSIINRSLTSKVSPQAYNKVIRRTLSTKSPLKAKWESIFKDSTTDRYARLNRFQQFQGGSGKNNTLLITTAFGIGSMAVIYFVSPYLFNIVPPFTHFKHNPKDLVYALLGANLVVFGLWRLPQCWRFLQRYMLLQKDHISSKWAIIGSAFSHQEFWHLGMNMLALWSFGTSLASILGTANFFSLYMNSAIAGSLFSLWYPKIARIMMIGPSLGASGALFGVFGCFSYLFPQAKILLFVFPIPGGAWVAFLGSVAWNLAGCVFRWGSFDYAAHLGGSLMGIAYGWYISHMMKKRRERRLQNISKWL
ncbi:rhomboid protease PCP1 [Nakaseomyces bracarensis]|uniref:rhomboid protease PCP1 n=1 Tax=Nakaseomyces bracarensis TaxID=273131 RepID=UPI0038716353